MSKASYHPFSFSSGLIRHHYRPQGDKKADQVWKICRDSINKSCRQKEKVDRMTICIDMDT